jgi:endoglucanase
MLWPRSRFRPLPLLIAGALFTATSIGAPAAAAQAPDPRGADPASPNPLAGLSFYVDHDSPAWRAWQTYTRRGQKKKAGLVRKIAREPRSIWLEASTGPNPGFEARRRIDAAKAVGAIPVFVVLRAETKRCAPTYQGGGPAADRAALSWYEALARGIGGDRVVIAFEPDSLGRINCLAPARRDDRYRLLGRGVDVLSALPGATVYLEGGASDWESAERTAKQLRMIGIDKVRGFMLNATHYDWTAANIRHGLDISRLTGGKHFIVNTAENGRGPVYYRTKRRGHRARTINIWCNPGLRGLGPPPTTTTSNPLADAYLWISRPGYAQSCQNRPVAWYAPRALTYGRYATDWEAPPRGTRFGHRKHYPRSAFGIP